MKNFIVFLIFTVLFTSCSNENAVVIKTPTEISFVDMRRKLEPILYYDGEICSTSCLTTKNNWIGRGFIGQLPNEFVNVYLGEPSLVFGKQIVNKAYNQIGYVVVAKYPDDETLNKVFNGIDGVAINSVNSVGEKNKSNKAERDWRQVAFIKCHFLIFIRSYGPLIEDVENYAFQLEGRLISVICK